MGGVNEASGGCTGQRRAEQCVCAEAASQSVSQSDGVSTERVSRGDDGLLLDGRISRLIGEHDGQMGPPVSPFLISTALGTERHYQKS